MALTAKQLKLQRAQLRRELERDARKADRARLAQLRGHLKAAKQHRRQRMKEVRELCRRGKAAAREHAKAIRARARAAAADEIEKVRARSRAKCEARKDRARAKSQDSLKRAAAALEAERQHQATMRLYEKPAKLKGARPSNGRRRRAEALQESESEVLSNIPTELHPVWRKVRTRIKASPRRTRTEAFLEWAHDHPADVLNILDAAYQADVAKMVREEAKLRREAQRPTTYKRLSDRELMKRYEAYQGAPEVPF